MFGTIFKSGKNQKTIFSFKIALGVIFSFLFSPGVQAHVSERIILTKSLSENELLNVKKNNQVLIKNVDLVHMQFAAGPVVADNFHLNIYLAVPQKMSSDEGKSRLVVYDIDTANPNNHTLNSRFVSSHPEWVGDDPKGFSVYKVGLAVYKYFSVNLYARWDRTGNGSDYSYSNQGEPKKYFLFENRFRPGSDGPNGWKVSFNFADDKGGAELVEPSTSATQLSCNLIKAKPGNTSTLQINGAGLFCFDPKDPFSGKTVDLLPMTVSTGESQKQTWQVIVRKLNYIGATNDLARWRFEY